MVTTETVRRLMQYGTAIEDYWNEGVLKHLPTYPLLGPDDLEPPAPPEETELREFLRSLPEDDVYTLLAVVQLRRKKVSRSEFDAGRATLRKQVPLTDAIEQLVMTTYLTADLVDGLRALRPDGLDVDALILTPA